LKSPKNLKDLSRRQLLLEADASLEVSDNVVFLGNTAGSSGGAVYPLPTDALSGQLPPYPLPTDALS
jgi:predicted outer membrane repeat protein